MITDWLGAVTVNAYVPVAMPHVLGVCSYAAHIGSGSKGSWQTIDKTASPPDNYRA